MRQKGNERKKKRAQSCGHLNKRCSQPAKWQVMCKRIAIEVVYGNI